MRTPKFFQIISLSGVMLATGLTSALAQTATWIGPSSGAEWNTAADWDLGVAPGNGTNALIGNATNVNYNVAMTATSFGNFTNQGTFSLNNSGFDCSSIVLNRPNGTSKLLMNSGGVASLTGGFMVTSNAIMVVSNGASLTVGGTLQLGTTGSEGTVTNFGGIISAVTTTVNNNNASDTSLFVVLGGTNNLGNVTINRAGPSGGNPLGQEGLILYAGEVNMTSLQVGGSGDNSFVSMLIANAAVTNTGSTAVHMINTAGRPARLLQTGGWYVDAAPNIVTVSSSGGATVNTIYSITGGTNIVGGFQFGDSAGDTGAVNFTNGSTIYVDTEGINSNGAVTIGASLNSGGLFGATASWTNNVAMKLSGGMFTFQTADPNGNPNNITISNILSGAGGFNKTGGGTLTLDAANTYSGNTMIYNSTLAVGGTGSLLNSLEIFVASGATFDVSQATSYTVGGSPAQTLMGYGTVNGAVNVASGGIVYPGSNALTGTLTINGGLNETGGAVNEFQLSGNPTGPNNDFLNASGGLNVSGVNTIQINGGLQSGGIYPLISYGSGGFSGTVANFNVIGASGTLSNSATAETIYFVVQSSVRGPTNLTWVGSVTNNNWDTETSTNWVDTGSATKDFFVPQDNVLFGNLEATSVINVVSSPTPGSITVNTTTNYTFAGTGSIGGTGGITVSNGMLLVLTTNGFSGPVVLDGGTLSTPVIANSSNPSGIGDSSSSPANFVFNGGTFNYYGGSASTDRGLTLTNGGGTIDVSNAATLTLNGTIVGNGTLNVVDGGTLVLNNGNSYTNTTTINGGVLQLSNAGGAGSGTINFNNGTLLYSTSQGITIANPWNFVANTTNMIVSTSGSSANPISTGAWTGSGDLVVSNTYNPYTVDGNIETYSGTIFLDTPNQAGFRFNSSGGNTSTGSTNATFDLSNTNALLLCRNPGVIDLGALRGALGAQVTGPSSTAGILTWSVGANNASTTYGGVIGNGTTPANEVGSLAKVGTGTLTLVGGVETVLVGLVPSTLATNLLQYFGNTTISNGTLAIIVPDALSNSTNVTLAASSAILDASQMGYVDPSSGNPVTNSVFELISGQTLSGLGTIRGFLQVDAGATFNVGLTGVTGVMTVTNAVTLNGTIQLKLNRTGSPTSDELISQASITNGGSLVVNNIGGQLQGGDTFTLFHATSYVGTFSSITLPTLTGNLTWNTSNLYVNGTISVVAPLSFTSIQTSGNNVVLNATGGTPSDTVNVLATTNLLLPLAQWTTLTTGTFDGSGNFSYTNSGALTSGKPQQFFILQVPPQ